VSVCVFRSYFTCKDEVTKWWGFFEKLLSSYQTCRKNNQKIWNFQNCFTSIGKKDKLVIFFSYQPSPPVQDFTFGPHVQNMILIHCAKVQNKWNMGPWNSNFEPNWNLDTSDCLSWNLCRYKVFIFDIFSCPLIQFVSCAPKKFRKKILCGWQPGWMDRFSVWNEKKSKTKMAKVENNRFDRPQSNKKQVFVTEKFQLPQRKWRTAPQISLHFLALKMLSLLWK